RLAERHCVVHRGGVGRAGVGAGDALHGGGRLVDRVNLAGGEVAIAGAGAAEFVAGGGGGGIVVGQVEPERAVARAGVDGDGVAVARTRYACDRGTADTAGGQGEVRRVDTADRLGKGDSIVHRGRRGRAGVGPGDALHSRHGAVDAVCLASEVAVAGAGAA